MRNFYYLFFLLNFIFGNAQAVDLFNPSNGVAYGAQQYFCTGENFNLKVDAVATSTGDYVITNDSPSNFPLGAGATNIIFPSTGPNKFSNAFPIGFNFSFYGKNYTKVVAGSNGRLVFTNSPELDQLNSTATYKDRTYSGITGFSTYSTLPSPDYNKVYQADPASELNLSQIFFGYTDLIPKSQTGSVNYTYKSVLVGTSKALLISYQNLIHTNGNGSGQISGDTYDSNVLLVEDGRIIIYVTSKTEDSYNAILGIQNDDASKFKVPLHSSSPSNYNNGHWKSEGVAWIFTPNQNLSPKFKWYQNTNLLGETSNTLSGFVPNDGDILKVEVSYFDPSGVQVGSTVSDQVIFKKIAQPVISSSGGSGCVSGVTLSVPADPDLNFEWFRTGNTTVLATGNTYYATQTGNYFLRASRKTAPLCSVDSNSINVNLNSTIPPFNVANNPFNFCDTTGATTKTVNLYDYYALNPTNYTVIFKEGGNVIPVPSSFQINANTVRNLTVDVNDPSSSCAINNLAFSLRFDSLPAAINNLPKGFCFGETSVDVSQYLQDVGGLNFSTFDYLFSTDGTAFSSNSVINPKVNSKVWIKISPKNPPSGITCNTVSTVFFSENAEIVVQPFTQFPEHCNSSTEFFDLNITKAQLEYSADIRASFYTDAALSNQITNLNYRGSGIVYIKIENTVTGCLAASVPQLDLKIYPKPALIKGTPETKYSQCGVPLFNLTTNISDYIGSWTHYSEIRYYDFAGNRLTQTEWENYDLAARKQPYMVFVYNSTNNLQCSDRVSFNLIEIKKPVSLKSQILICAETTYSLQDFKNQVAANSSQFTFTDTAGNPLPNSFNWSSLPFTVNFLMKDNATNCTSDPQYVTFAQGGNSALLTTETDYVLCGSDFDGKTDFDLNSKKATFTSNPAATFEYFKDAGLLQTIPANYTNETEFAQTIFVRVTLPNFCPSIAKINLLVNIPTQSSTLQDKYFICYGETVTVDAGAENTSWKWSTGETTQKVDFSRAGNFSVLLTNADGCSYTHSFVISDENQPKIEVINQTNSSIEVIANGGVKPYQYYFNGIPQASNILQNPTASSYEIQVESATGCFGPPKTVYFIKINNAFTPNGDGKNDIWKIDNLDKMQEVSIKIVNRNGIKVFESTNPAKSEWDGKQNGRELPTSAYWYLVSWYDAVTQKTEQRQGWILLKNRN